MEVAPLPAPVFDEVADGGDVLYRGAGNKAVAHVEYRWNLTKGTQDMFGLAESALLVAGHKQRVEIALYSLVAFAAEHSKFHGRMLVYTNRIDAGLFRCPGMQFSRFHLGAH